MLSHTHSVLIFMRHIISPIFWHSAMCPMGIRLCLTFTKWKKKAVEKKAKVECFISFRFIIFMSWHCVDTYIGWDMEFISFSFLFFCSLIPSPQILRLFSLIFHKKKNKIDFLLHLSSFYLFTQKVYYRILMKKAAVNFDNAPTMLNWIIFWNIYLCTRNKKWFQSNKSFKSQFQC